MMVEVASLGRPLAIFALPTRAQPRRALAVAAIGVKLRRLGAATSCTGSASPARARSRARSSGVLIERGFAVPLGPAVPHAAAAARGRARPFVAADAVRLVRAGHWAAPGPTTGAASVA